jgi:hypothetical protein
MFAALGSAAWACTCGARPPTLVLPDEAHVTGPIRIFLHDRWPDDGVEQVVAQLRVRGPGGALVPVTADVLGARLDLVPTRPLDPGRYTIEQRLTYADGEIVPLLEPPEGREVRQAWFATRALQIVDGAGEIAAVPAVDWDRTYVPSASSCGPASTIRARVPPVDGARWLEVEVSGLGVVASVPAQEAGFYVSVSDGPCSPRKITLPADRAVQVRGVAVGLDGDRAPGAWTRLDPVGAAHPPAGGAPVGRCFDVPLQTGATVEVADACGALHRLSQTVVEADLPRFHRFDWSDDGLRRVWGVDGGLRIDGGVVAVPDVSGTPFNPVMVADGPRTYVAYARDRTGRGPVVVAAVEGGAVLWSSEVDGAGSPASIAITGAALEVRWSDLAPGSRRVQRQRFDADGIALGGAEVDLDGTPLQVRMGGLYWLGEALPVPGAGHLSGTVARRDGIDYALYGGRRGHLARGDPRGIRPVDPRARRGAGPPRRAAVRRRRHPRPMAGGGHPRRVALLRRRTDPGVRAIPGAPAPAGRRRICGR